MFECTMMSTFAHDGLAMIVVPVGASGGLPNIMPAT
jgi:hypothetical protein